MNDDKHTSDPTGDPTGDPAGDPTGVPGGDPKAWADRPAFQKNFFRGLIAFGVLVALAGFVPAFQKDHPHFPAEGVPIFFAIWGFAAFMFIVLAGQHLRKLVGRAPGYYEERE
ncbi:MAG: hypothetical protein EVA70_01660 [Parvularculaceae bacterium]|nr:MAG: hypothetical protein EVA70_01660 [Parvularculaceae bacterium]